MADFKDDFHATLEDAITIQNAFQYVLKDTHYFVAIFGSTVYKGKGHDIDVIIRDTENADITAQEVAEKIVSTFSKRLILFEVLEHDESDTTIYINFISKGDRYIDLIVEGIT